MACTINIAQGLIRSAINQRAVGNIYWIADKEPYSFNDIIKTINARNTKNLLLKKNEAIKNIRTIPNGDKKKGKILCK